MYDNAFVAMEYSYVHFSRITWILWWFGFEELGNKSFNNLTLISNRCIGGIIREKIDQF